MILFVTPLWIYSTGLVNSVSCLINCTYINYGKLPRAAVRDSESRTLQSAGATELVSSPAVCSDDWVSTLNG
jgi:hypothetical protein